MVKKTQKEEIVKNIKENFIESKSIIFYNFHNSEDRDIFKLKKELRKAGAFWKVCKNNLVKRAIAPIPFDIKGANALIFCKENEFKPLEILKKSNRGFFNGGIYENNFVEKIIIEKWASLPSREVLIKNIVYCLSFNLVRLQKILEEIKKKV